jgi:hypothetical protein
LELFSAMIGETLQKENSEKVGLHLFAFIVTRASKVSTLN